jgi:hypothetical protein
MTMRRRPTLIQEYEARIAALERLVGKQALKRKFLKGALKNAPPPRRGLYLSSPAPQDLCHRRPRADEDQRARPTMTIRKSRRTTPQSWKPCHDLRRVRVLRIAQQPFHHAARRCLHRSVPSLDRKPRSGGALAGWSVRRRVRGSELEHPYAQRHLIESCFSMSVM